MGQSRIWDTRGRELYAKRVKIWHAITVDTILLSQLKIVIFPLKVSHIYPVSPQ